MCLYTLIGHLFTLLATPHSAPRCSRAPHSAPRCSKGAGEDYGAKGLHLHACVSYLNDRALCVCALHMRVLTHTRM